MTLGSHQRCVGKSQTHLTPRWVISALGPFDLDPCAAEPRPWDCARNNYTEHGLQKEWFGRVWLNPPFDRYEVGAWVRRLGEHGRGTLLLHARTETQWFRRVWEYADQILFLSRRMRFCDSEGVEAPANSGAPLVLAAFGDRDSERLHAISLGGYLVRDWVRQ